MLSWVDEGGKAHWDTITVVVTLSKINFNTWAPLEEKPVTAKLFPPYIHDPDKTTLAKPKEIERNEPRK